MNKEKWLDIAEVIDALRVIPRALLAAGWILAFTYVYFVTGWYIGLENPTSWDMGFISSTISSLFLAVQALTGKYFDSGGSWKDRRSGLVDNKSPIVPKE